MYTGGKKGGKTNGHFSILSNHTAEKVRKISIYKKEVAVNRWVVSRAGGNTVSLIHTSVSWFDFFSLVAIFPLLPFTPWSERDTVVYHMRGSQFSQPEHLDLTGSWREATPYFIGILIDIRDS